MNIVVLAGGLSPERNVSLSSGVMVTNALLAQGHKAILVDLFFGTDNLPENPADAFLSAKPVEKRTISEIAPDLEALKRERKSGLSDLVGNGVVELCRAADIVYLALHGADGENGRLQAFFDLHGIRYTGSPSLGCALAMDKWITKQLFLGANIPTPRGMLLKKGEPVPAFEYDCVVKPCCGGSSIGIAIAHTAEEYEAAVQDAFRYEDSVLVEEYIEGRELTCGILGGNPLPLTEIIPRQGFYDYAHKYQPGWTEEITPARVDADVTARVQEITRRIQDTLHLAVYFRADYLLTADGRIYCLEANTLPGMTPTSLLPQGAAAAGIDYPTLCETIVSLSLEKYA